MKYKIYFGQNAVDNYLEKKNLIDISGNITDDNIIEFNDDNLSNGIYKLKYIDEDNNQIDNFDNITEINIIK